MEIDETMLESEQELTDVSIDTETDADTEDIDGGDEFDYDEDGNIIIPDVTDDEDADADENGEVDASDEEAADGEEAGTEPQEVPDGQNADKARILELETKLKRLQAQGKNTLKALGVDTDDVLAGLTKLAAEAEGISPEEYAKRQSSAETVAQAQRLLQRTEFEKKASADLAELHAAFPDTRQYTDIRKIPNIKRFGELRDLGLSPKEAYSAANPDSVRTQVADAVKKQSLQDTKKHLRSAVPKGSKDTAPKMTKNELSQWRDIFPDLSDKEILQLYRQTEDKE